MRKSAWIPLSCLMAALMVACGRGASGAAGFQSAAQLAEALRKAGAEVAETQKAGLPYFGMPAYVWQVNASEVQAYEFAGVAEREAVSSTIAADGSVVRGIKAAWTDRPNIWAAGKLIVLYQGTDGGTILLLSGLLGDPLTQPDGGSSEPYPPAIAASIRRLAEELKLEPGSIDVVAFAPVEWPDACLGLPAKGEICAQILTPGWRVRLRANAREYELHSDQVGEQVRILEGVE